MLLKGNEYILINFFLEIFSLGITESRNAEYVIVIAWCRVQYGIYFSSYFCFQILHEREARVQYENKNNEKNISHIARRFHAIISLSYGIFIMFWLFCIDVGRKNRVFDVRYISF